MRGIPIYHSFWHNFARVRENNFLVVDVSDKAKVISKAMVSRLNLFHVGRDCKD